MSKPSPIWQQLPLNFKKDVVAHLGIRSRLRLQICSKSDHDLVSACPMNMERIYVRLGLEPNLQFRRLNDPVQLDENGEEHCLVSVSIRFPGNRKEKEVILQTPKDAAVYLSKLFANRKSYSKEFFYYQGAGKEQGAVQFSRGLKELLRFPMSVAVLDFPIRREHDMELLKLMDPCALRQITLSSEIPESLVEGLVATEQWRRLKVFKHQMTWCPLKVDHLLHLEKFVVHGLNCSEENVKQVIEHFQTRPIGSSFEIHLSNRCSIDLLENPRSPGTGCSTHSVVYPTTTEGVVLNVQFFVFNPAALINMTGVVRRDEP